MSKEYEDFSALAATTLNMIELADQRLDNVQFLALASLLQQRLHQGSHRRFQHLRENATTPAK